MSWSAVQPVLPAPHGAAGMAHACCPVWTRHLCLTCQCPVAARAPGTSGLVSDGSLRRCWVSEGRRESRLLLVDFLLSQIVN